jgi:hypothetical protein
MEEHRNVAPLAQTEDGEINWLYMTPLLGAPLLPLGNCSALIIRRWCKIINDFFLIKLFKVRIVLRPYPKIRDVAFGTLIVFFLGHGAWLIGRHATSHPHFYLFIYIFIELMIIN